MNVVTGDLVKMAQNGDFDVIVHGCNCFCTMGGGIALPIRNTFPEAYQADLMTVKGAKNKLGTYSHAHINRDGLDLIVVNAYTQYKYGDIEKERQERNNPHFTFVSYDAIYRAFSRVQMEFSGKRIGFPAIGAGLAGGDWDSIAALINKTMAGEDFTLVEFSG